jgi:hypothetical protein
MSLRETVSKYYDGVRGWIKRITFYEIACGMKATLSHLIRYKPVTLQYPHEKRILPDNYPGMLPCFDMTIGRTSAWAVISAKRPVFRGSSRARELLHFHRVDSPQCSYSHRVSNCDQTLIRYARKR